MPSAAAQDTRSGAELRVRSGTPVAIKASETDRTLVSLCGITKRFLTRAGAEVTAVQDVSLDIARDQFVTLVGPSGCGKSTLLKLIGGVAKPTEGEIIFDGRRLERPSRSSGLIFQRPVLLPWRTVLDNVLFPIEMLGWPTSSYREEALRLIELVGL